jgi:V/A-type H+-transporting ATPase subunit E
LVISTSEAEELKAFFTAKAKDLLDKGVEVKQINGVKGFSVSPADGSYKVNFGEGEFETFLKSFLRPQIVELLF